MAEKTPAEEALICAALEKDKAYARFVARSGTYESADDVRKALFGQCVAAVDVYDAALAAVKKERQP